MPSSVRNTWALLALAFVAILPVAFFVFRDVARDVFALCTGSLEADPDALSSLSTGASLVGRGDPEPGGFDLYFGSSTNSRGVHGTEITRVEHDTKEDVACTCASYFVATDASRAVDVRRVAPGRYIVVEMAYGGKERIVDGFRATSTPTRSFQANRLVRRRHIPAVVVLFALGALGIAFVRSRRGIAYATRIHAWTEASLDANGRIQSDTGETLGVLDSAGRHVAPGAVLVAPSATETKGIYRDVPILPRDLVALGSHARWRETTMRGLRDARALCAISAACSASAFAAKFLGG